MGESGASWIDYVIASGDTSDRSLAAEFAANWAANQALDERLLAIGPTRETFYLLDQRQKITNDLQRRVAARGRYLRAIGSMPAESGVFEAWIDLETRPRPLS
jgi:hypothetical protein